ncbi:hypothetical protein BN2537_16967 [Streptomyces venezuelae]|nr:hypothetical protein BN2537_16967 [Streptomyces venezuelae]
MTRSVHPLSREWGIPKSFAGKDSVLTLGGAHRGLGQASGLVDHPVLEPGGEALDADPS